MLGFGGGQVGSSLINVLLTPVNRAAMQDINRAFPNQPVDLPSLILAQHKGFQDTGFNLQDYAKSLGYNGMNLNLSDLVSWQDVSLGTMISLYIFTGGTPEGFQGYIDKVYKGLGGGGNVLSDDFKATLNASSIKLEDFKKALAASAWHPSPSDITRWTIFHAYDDAAIKRYNLDEGLSDELLTRYRKAGMIDEYATREWYATWRYPSFYEARYLLWLTNYVDVLEGSTEDYAKKIIGKHPRDKAGKLIKYTEDDFRDTMRLNNYPSYFQQLLSQIAYTPISRREIQELYKAGTIGIDEMRARFLRLGYSEVDADRLVEWSKVQYAPEDEAQSKEYTRGLIDNLYKYNRITGDQYDDYMSKLGYSKDATSLYHMYIDFQRELENYKKLIKETENYYRAGIISTQQAYSKLTSAGVDPNDAQMYVDQWKKYITVIHKKLTLTELFKMYTAGVLDTAQKLYDKIRELNYSDEDAKLIMKMGLYTDYKVSAPTKIIERQRKALEAFLGVTQA